MRIIDADALGTQVIKTHIWDKGDVIRLIESAPTINTKEIKYYDDDEGVWKIGRVIVDGDNN